MLFKNWKATKYQMKQKKNKNGLNLKSNANPSNLIHHVLKK